MEHWYGILPERERMALTIKLFENPDATSIEISQELPRMTVRDDRKLSTLLPGSKLMIFIDGHEPRLLTGFEACWMQGFPRAVLDKVVQEDDGIDDTLLWRIAGKPFSGIIPTAHLLSAIAHMTPRQLEIMKEKAPMTRVLNSFAEDDQERP